MRIPTSSFSNTPLEISIDSGRRTAARRTAARRSAANASSVTLSAGVGSCRETCLVLCAGSSCCYRSTVPEKAAVVRRTLTHDSTRHFVTPDIRPTGPPTSWVYTLRRPVLQPCGERSRAENYNKRHNKFIFFKLRNRHFVQSSHFVAVEYGLPLPLYLQMSIVYTSSIVHRPTCIFAFFSSKIFAKLVNLKP